MKMIEPGGIPQFTGNFEQLDKDVSGLRGDAIGIRNGGADVHSRFQMLGAYYTAPEADDLFATTQPVMDRADTFATDLETVADALDTFAAEARPLAKKLETLRDDARAFADSVEGDDDWTYDGDKTDRNNELVDGVAEAESAFRAAERRAASKISAIVGGPKFIEDDGSHKSTKKTVMYGYDADLLKKAKELPWGSHVSESIHAWEIHRHIKHYVWDGFIIDGGLATLKGLGPLVGIGGSAKDAWSNLGDVVSGIGQYTMTPIDWALDHTIGPDDSSGDNKQKAAAREFGKSLVAWDQWDENPVQAAGTTTFNVLTLGAGPLGAAAKGGAAGKAGMGAKAAGIGAKIGTYADPLAAGLTVGGKAISKLPTVADLTARVRTGAGATPDLQRVHSTLDFEGSKVVIEDGKFIRVDAEGNPIKDTAPNEKSAADRATPEETPSRREGDLVGAGARTPGASAHAGGNLPPQAGHGVRTDGGRDFGGGAESNGVARETGHHGAGGSGAAHGGDSGAPASDASTGDTTAGGSHHTSQPDGVGTGGADGPPSRGAASKSHTQEVIRRQVEKANNDKAWFEKYYRPSDGHRHNVKARDENGDLLPVLRHVDPDDPTSPWTADRAPREHAKYKSEEPVIGRPSTVSPAYIDDLQDATARRDTAITKDQAALHDLLEAKEAHKALKSPETEAALAEARAAYKPAHTEMRDAGEALGEKSAEFHAIRDRFPGARKAIPDELLRGSGRLDQIWDVGKGRMVIVEAKASSGTELGDRAISGGRRVEQGHPEYLDSILDEMRQRGGKEAQVARDIRRSLRAKKLTYILVKAKPKGAQYDGYLMWDFKTAD
ncbi:hypothetical protein ACFWZ2_37015 [Streptomyces sp. NPDC059002]|uniref:hypothetical protein n=1 Tax=Streptomyces sp. NPDC059002 TaxID=3346690 RepID=UPI00367A69A1